MVDSVWCYQQKLGIQRLEDITLFVVKHGLVELYRSMEITFVLLGISICAVWCPSIAITKNIRFPPWLIFFCLAVISGLVFGYLSYEACFILGVYISSAYLAQRVIKTSWVQYLFEAIVILLTIGLVLHQLPGFHNPLLVDGLSLSTNAAPLSFYAKFDKASAGLVMLAFFCQRSRSLSEVKSVLKQTLPIILSTVIVLMVLTMALGYTELDFKLPQITGVFLFTKLFFTCVAEEAIFRGFIQERLSKLLLNTHLNVLIAVFGSGVLFGLVHAAGGVLYIFLATLAGISYAYAYFLTRRIEAPIFIHFALITVHFIGFTYPYIYQR